jgi:pimeloyl-ACP methyl ester carboxylesterase
LTRPDIFQRLVLMSAPFAGPPAIGSIPAAAGPGRLDSALAALSPPRKHYRSYYSTPQANADLLNAPQGTAAALRAYYHMKSADWPENQPHPLAEMSAEALAELPRYYVMDLDATMAETVAPHLPDTETCNRCRWLTPAELDVYVEEFTRRGFQGGLNWYRAVGLSSTEQRLFAGRQIEQPSLFLAGASDWGIYQTPGAFEAMQQQALADLRGVHLIEGAGHWLQQEQPIRMLEHLTSFLQHTNQKN